jgi:4-amino-4-deoxy-L-arabinose transferase-like glycosyltransferase
MPSQGLSTQESLMERQSVSPQTSKTFIYVLMGLLMVYSTIRSVLAAAGRPFWFDELFTLTVSQQGSWKGIMGALRNAADSHPPLFYVIEHFSTGLFRNTEIALRLPSILAFQCTLVCVFVYVKKRRGEVVAFLCALFMPMTVVFQYYATEARAYSMVVACVAFALVCYQRARFPIWAVFLAMSLALAEAVHYLAVLAMVPFEIAEALVFLRTRKVRWAVWGALVVGTLPLLIFWNLLAIFKTHFGPGLYSRFFQFSLIPRIYGEPFVTDSKLGAGVGALALCGIVGTFLQLRSNRTEHEDGTELAEAALLFALVSLPFLCITYSFALPTAGLKGDTC